MDNEFNLPQDYKPYIDKYFLRAKEILEKENLNPIVKYQVFIRQGGCKVYGINEAIAILKKYCKAKSLEIYSLSEGDFFGYGECIMTIKAPIQDLIDLETMYLGVLSEKTTIKNGGHEVDLVSIKENMRKIVDLVNPRPVSYFGARHWHWQWDKAISAACALGGATNCSTDIGASNFPEPFNKGIGTIPHSLEAIYHWRYSKKFAVEEATKAFNYHIDERIPRIALVDYANREIMDSLYVAESLGEKLYGIRIDTCGENYMQGVLPITDAYNIFQRTGVSRMGVYLVRKLLNDKGFEDVKIILSSGFGDIEKVRNFVNFEDEIRMKLFDGLGVGGVFESNMATADIIEVDGRKIHKVGRLPKDFSKLKKVV